MRSFAREVRGVSEEAAPMRSFAREVRGVSEEAASIVRGEQRGCERGHAIDSEVRGVRL
jgi:hypothetical protein